MLRFIHNGSITSTANPPQTITLYITKSGPGGGYVFSYGSNSSMLLGAGPTMIIINIEKINLGLDNVSVISYAANGFLMSNTSHTPTSPITGFNVNVIENLQGNFTSVSFTLNMNPFQIIDFGLLVTVTPTAFTVVCDPQASNDPRLSGSGLAVC